jgi:hypothetical protein
VRIRSMMIPQGGGTFPLTSLVWGRGVFGWNLLNLIFETRLGLD